MAKEVRLWTVAVGNAPGLFARRKVKRAAAEAFRWIQQRTGFVAFCPRPPQGTLCLFRSKEDAQRAKDMMEWKGIRTGRNICECFADVKYLPPDMLDALEVVETPGTETGTGT